MDAPEEHSPAEQTSVRSVLSDILTRITVLVRKEFDLARSELAENLNMAAMGLGLVVGAIVFALTALNVLAVAAVIGLIGTGLESIWAALIVGIGALIVAAVLCAVGVSRLKPSNLAPRRAEREMRRNVDAVKEAFDA